MAENKSQIAQNEEKLSNIMKNVFNICFCLISIFLLFGCANKAVQPDEIKLEKGECLYEGQKAACNRLSVYIDKEYSQMIEPVKKLFIEFDAEVIYEYDAYIGWAIKLKTEEQMFELKKRLENIEGVRVKYDRIGSFD